MRESRRYSPLQPLSNLADGQIRAETWVSG
jgi:hypothetical protein